MAVDSSRYSTHLQLRLEAFITALAEDTPVSVIARCVEDTAPAGWPLDLPEEPTAAVIAEALAEGSVG